MKKQGRRQSGISGISKTFLSAALCLAALTTSVGEADAMSFEDLRGHWAKDTIEFAVQDGIVDGYADGTFKPDHSISRAEFIKMAVIALKFKPSAAAGEWYSPFVQAALSNGVHSEKDFATGDMNTPITREEMARLAVRATGQANYEDKKWMYLATSKGIINGLDDAGTLGPEEPTTRAQAVTVIRRIQKIKEGASLPKDKYAISAAEIYWHKTNVYTMAPEYFGLGKDNNHDFKADKLRYDAPNGYSEVEKYIIVDMDDPSDPNRKLIPQDMTWTKSVGRSRIKTTEVPENTYAFLSFNHFVVDLEKDSDMFRFSHLTVLPFLNRIDNVDADGNLVNITSYAPYDPTHKAVQWGFVAGLKAGHHDIRIVTGQLAPKGKGGIDGYGIPVRREPAQELGESYNTDIFSSYIDFNLIGR